MSKSDFESSKCSVETRKFKNAEQTGMLTAPAEGKWTSNSGVVSASACLLAY